MRQLLLLTTALLCGCGESVWVPALALPWDAEAGVPEDQVADDCEVTYSSVIADVGAGSLFAGGDVVGELPPNPPLELVGASPRTFGEVRVDASVSPEVVTYDLDALTVEFAVTCGDPVTGTLETSPVDVVCAAPDGLEVDPQASFGTFLTLHVGALFGEEPDAIAGRVWLDADDGDGVLDAREVEAVVGAADLLGRLAASSDAGPCEVTAR